MSQVTKYTIEIDSERYTGELSYAEMSSTYTEIPTGTTNQSIEFAGVTSASTIFIISTQTVTMRINASDGTAITVTADIPLFLPSQNITAIYISNASGSTANVTLKIYGDSASGSTTSVTADEFNVMNYGAKGNGTDDDTAALQAAIDAAITAKGRVKVPHGSFLFSTLSFTACAAVSNSAQFGVEFVGSGTGTRLIHDGSTANAFNFNHASNDIRVRIADFFLYDNIQASPTRIGFNLGIMNRYSVFENIRTYGFRSAFKFNQAVQGLTFQNIGIRGCGRYGIVGAALSSNINFRWFGGYVDNCGRDSYSLGTWYPALHAYNWAICQVYSVVIEGNYAGGFQVTGGDGFNTFIGCRFEETGPTWAAVGNISELSSDTNETMFRDCYFAFPGTNYNMMTIASAATFDHCLIADTDASGGTPFNLSGNPTVRSIVSSFTGCDANPTSQVTAYWAHPTASPSTSPSASPSGSPSTSPSKSASASPSTSPSLSPSTSPSKSASTSPSTSPSASPSKSPSKSPSASPSTSPSASPSTSPSTSPSASPSSGG